eukprot:GFUD01026119.1.p1 GENE.GFUD01026119.1~~GFUD01026119.1.p1  ORF type:complete len:372 (-),score=51.24 GFUD01026119.1:124-1239(-)
MDTKDRMNLLLTKGPLLAHNIGYMDGDKRNESFDDRLLKTGISFFHKNFFSMFVGMLTGLLSLMYIESISAVLSLTNKSSSPILAFQRYLGTLKHTLRWYKGVASLQESLKTVRAKHQHAANLASGSEHFMTQFDMVLTQWAFIGPALLYPGKLGILKSSEKDMEGLVHIMYLVGRDLGVREDLNLCTGGLEPAVEYSELILKQVIRKTFGSQESSETCKELARHLLDGVNILNPFIDQTAFHCWSDQVLNEQKQKETPTLEGFSQVLFSGQTFVLETLIHVPVIGQLIRSLANNLMKWNIYLAADWSRVMVDNYNSPKVNMGLGQMQAFLAIPVFTFISAGSIVHKELKGNWMFLAMILSFFTFAFLLIL